MARLDPDYVFPSIYRCSLYPEGLGCSKRTRRRHLQADIQLGKQVVDIQEDRDLDVEFDTRSLCQDAVAVSFTTTLNGPKRHNN